MKLGLLAYLLANKFVRPSVLLDLGCGKGSDMSRLCKRRFSYAVGCDIDPPSLRQAKRVYDDVVVSDVGYLPFKARSFDTVMVCEVLEHLEPEKCVQALDEIERCSYRVVLLTTPTTRGQKPGLRYINAP